MVKVLDYVRATALIAQTTLRSILGQSDLDHLLSERDKINQDLQRAKIIHAEGEFSASEQLAAAAQVIGSQPATIIFPVPIDLLQAFTGALAAPVRRRVNATERIISPSP